MFKALRDSGMGRQQVVVKEEDKRVVITNVVQYLINAGTLHDFLKTATSEERKALCVAIRDISKASSNTPYHKALMQRYGESVIHFTRMRNDDGVVCAEIQAFVVEYMDFLVTSGT
jgi:hypothetical protein